MFNWFRKYNSPPAYPNWGDIPPPPPIDDYPEVPAVKAPVRSYPDDGYTVGVNDDGDTILKVTCNYSTTTLTMNTAGVLQMIRLLEATISQEDEEATSNDVE
jgi:hypothetical protein